MAEYISRDDAEKALLERCKETGYGGLTHDDIRLVMRTPWRIPPADVRPVVRGKWIQTTQPMGWREEDCAECSVCGEDFVLDEWAMDDFTNLMHYCPNCGADMREPPKEGKV